VEIVIKEIMDFPKERIVIRTSAGSPACLCALAALLFFSHSARAEFDFDFDPSGQKLPHHLTIQSDALPTEGAGDGGGSYGERNLSLSGSLQVASDSQVKDDQASATGYFVRPQLDRRLVTGLGAVNRDVTLDTEGVGVSAFHLAETKEAYFFGAGVSHSGEAGSSGASLWIPTIYAAGTYHFNQDTALIYGAAFSTSFGFFFPVPVLGLTSQLSQEWRFTTILPVVTEFSWRPVDQWSFAAFLKAEGYESKIANDHRFDSPDSSVEIKTRAFELGIGADYEISNAFSIRGNLGALAARQLQFEDGSGTLAIQKLQAAPFLMTLSGTAHFGSGR
jgi:hypothetical protein